MSISAIIGFILGILLTCCLFSSWLNRRIKKGYFELNEKTYIIRDEKDYNWNNRK